MEKSIYKTKKASHSNSIEGREKPFLYKILILSVVLYHKLK